MKKKAETLGDWLKRTGTTHEALAAELGVSRSYVTLIASGDRQPSLRLAFLIEQKTGVAASSLVMGAVA